MLPSLEDAQCVSKPAFTSLFCSSYRIRSRKLLANEVDVAFSATMITDANSGASGSSLFTAVVANITASVSSGQLQSSMQSTSALANISIDNFTAPVKHTLPFVA